MRCPCCDKILWDLNEDAQWNPYHEEWDCNVCANIIQELNQSRWSDKDQERIEEDCESLYLLEEEERDYEPIERFVL